MFPHSEFPSFFSHRGCKDKLYFCTSPMRLLPVVEEELPTEPVIVGQLAPFLAPLFQCIARYTPFDTDSIRPWLG